MTGEETRAREASSAAFDDMVAAARNFERLQVMKSVQQTVDHGINMRVRVLRLRSDHRGGGGGG